MRPEAPGVGDVERIVAIVDPVRRNLEITYCYSRLSSAMAARTGAWSNWCTFATWASRQAGATIRGEDLIDRLDRRLRQRSQVLHPIRSLWRALLRRGVFRPATRLGRIVRAIHTPLDAFERTSDAVARGNLKVFEEIGREFARYLDECAEQYQSDSPEFTRYAASLRPGDPPDGQQYLRRAFTRYQQQRFETNPAIRAELVALANLEIGFHEQTRLQPEIRESLDSPLTTARDLRRRVLDVLLPASGLWRTLLGRGPVGALIVGVAAAVHRFSARLSREVITECLMVLSLPDGAALSLGRPLDARIPDAFQRPTQQDFKDFLGRFERCPATHGNSGADDWSVLPERMHFILHLFCAMNERRDLFSQPFSDEQIQQILAGRVPDGTL